MNFNQTESSVRANNLKLNKIVDFIQVRLVVQNWCVKVNIFRQIFTDHTDLAVHNRKSPPIADGDRADFHWECPFIPT